MPGHLQLFATLLGLACVSSAELLPVARTQEGPRPLSAREMVQIEDEARYALYSACGGSREMRCEQYAPQGWRGVPPRMMLHAMRCSETSISPKRTLACTFSLEPEGRPAVACKIDFWERSETYGTFWSDKIFDPPKPSIKREGVTDVQIGRSSLVCPINLLAATFEPEPIDPAPAKPAEAWRDLTRLLADDEYLSSIRPSQNLGVTTMRLRIGTHGHVDLCTVVHSSGVADFDGKACDRLRTEARFQPAENGQGQRVAVEIEHRQDWNAPTRSPARP